MDDLTADVVLSMGKYWMTWWALISVTFIRFAVNSGWLEIILIRIVARLLPFNELYNNYDVGH